MYIFTYSNINVQSNYNWMDFFLLGVGAAKIQVLIREGLLGGCRLVRSVMNEHLSTIMSLIAQEAGSKNVVHRFEDGR